MDAGTKRRTAELVRHALTKMLADRGFIRGKPTYWVKPKQHVLEFLHLHLFTHAPTFRVHSGIRVLNDAIEAPALNGPDSDSCRTDACCPYNFEFSEDDASVARCAEEISRFIREVAEPWFERFAEASALASADSPLGDSERRSLEQSLSGRAEPENVLLSKQLLGVA